MDTYVHFIYQLTKKFPKEELFGSTSQFTQSGFAGNFEFH